MIYILQGSTGEYSDRTDWIVRAYHEKDAADSSRTKADYEAAQCKKAVAEYEELESYTNNEWSKIDAEIIAIRSRLLTVDLSAQFDYTGTTYWVVPCELL